MKRLRSLLILVAFALMPLLAFATNEGGEKSEGLDFRFKAKVHRELFN